MKYKAKTKDGRIIEGYYVPVNYGDPVIVRGAYQNEDGSIEWVYEPVLPESLEVAEEQPKWIHVTERLPDEGEYVEIWCGTNQIARIEKGITEEQRAAMKRGEMEDPEEMGWCLASGYRNHRRSSAYKRCDEFGNNTVPYCWIANGGPMQWKGQDVTHWRKCTKPPKGDE